MVFDVACVGWGLSRLKCFLARVLRFSRIFAVDMADVIAQAKDRAAGDSRGQKRAFEDKRGWHAPWDAPPVQVVDLLNGRSRLEEFTGKQLWDYMSHPTEVLKWRTECPRACLCLLLSRVCVCVSVCACVCVCVCVCGCESRFAGDVERQGIAISRAAAILAMVCARIMVSDHPIRQFVDRGKFAAVIAEAEKLAPHFKGLVASEALKKRARRKDRQEHSQACMMLDASVGLPRPEVERDAKAVYAWLVAEKSPLRDFLSACSDGACFFTANVHGKVSAAYVKHRQDSTDAVPGVVLDDFVRAAVSRLCD